MSTYEYEVIFSIVNAGFADTVMDAARAFGAMGGTVIHARGTANGEAEKLFGITIQPDKEIVMILIPSALGDAILHAIYQQAGSKTPAQGIAFSLPVDSVEGLRDGAAGRARAVATGTGKGTDE